MCARSFSLLHRARQRIDCRRTAENRPLETLIDDPVILDIKIGKPAASEQRDNHKCGQSHADYGVAGDEFFPRLRAVLSFRDSYFDGHASQSRCKWSSMQPILNHGSI